MRFSSRSGFEEVEVDMTPMIDVTFLLLIFFVIVSTLTRMETAAEVELPLADQAAVEDELDPEQLVINVEKSGDIYVIGQKFSTDELGGILAEEAKKSLAPDGFSNRTIVIRGDDEVPYSHIQWIIKECLSHGIWRLHLAATQKSKARR